MIAQAPDTSPPPMRRVPYAASDGRTLWRPDLSAIEMVDRTGQDPPLRFCVQCGTEHPLPKVNRRTCPDCGQDALLSYGMLISLGLYNSEIV